MSQEMRGSEKLKAKCRTMASLTSEEIAQIAGGHIPNPDFRIPVSGNINIFPGIFINGMPPPDLFVSKLLQTQVNKY